MLNLNCLRNLAEIAFILCRGYCSKLRITECSSVLA
jgi:hypothetical protein